ncbi:MAG: hypothetical protein GY742_17150 [Hyphomicrobiales bacterium]|nr:hypothetical protein [Hyphomicrobiales bacterium]
MDNDTRGEIAGLGKKLVILLGALDATMPYCKRVGLETDIDKAYDEWEDLVV